MDNDLIFGTDTDDMLAGADADDTQLAAAPSLAAPFDDALARPFDAAQVVIPEGENIVRIPVAPGEVVELPFPADAQYLARVDNGNLAIRVGDVTVILQGYVAAAEQNPPVIEAANGQPLDIATILASTDPTIDIETAAGPAAGPQGQGADNTGAFFAQLGLGAGLGGFTGVGAQDGTDGPGGGTVEQNGTLFTPFGLPVPTLGVLTAADEHRTTDEDTKILDGKVTATDPEGDPLTYSVVGALPPGVTFNADGTFTFDPAGNYESLNTDSPPSTISFQYKANDGTNDSNVATVTIDITGVNDAPKVIGGTAGFIRTEDSPDVTQDIQFVIKDPDDTKFTVTIDPASLPAGVSYDESTQKLHLDTKGHYDYLKAGDKEVFTLTFTVTDEHGGTTTRDVSLTINGVNDAPVAADVHRTTDEDTKILDGKVSVTDAEGDALTYSVVGALPPGVTFNPDGTWTFDPAGNYESLNTDSVPAQVSFQYKANDGTADSKAATVTIDINGVNDAPKVIGGTAGFIRTEDSPNVTQDIQFLIKDPDDTKFTVTIDPASLPDGVSYDAATQKIHLDTKGHYDYLGAGDKEVFTLTFTITDEHGGSTTRDVSLTINGVNDAPVASADTILGDGGVATFPFPQWVLTVNDKDAEGDLLLVNNIGGFMGTGKEDLQGVFGLADVTLNYTVTDGTATSAAATVLFKHDTDGVADSVTGTDGNDIIVGSFAAPEALHGGKGDDIIAGFGGGDEIFGGAGDDTLVFNGAAYGTGDTIHGEDDSVAVQDGLEGGAAMHGDVLAVADLKLDFSDSASVAKIDGIETISTEARLGGFDAQSVTIGAQSVQGLSDHTITPGGVFPEKEAVRIDGDAVDQLYLSISKDGGNWADTGVEVNGYHIFAHETVNGDSTSADAYVMVQAANVGNVHLNQDAP